MKTKKLAMLGFNAAALLVALLLSVSCENPAGSDTPDTPVCNAATAFLGGGNNSAWGGALKSLFPNADTNITDSTEVVVINSSVLGANKSALKNAYDGGALLVTLEPTASELSDMETLGWTGGLVSGISLAAWDNDGNSFVLNDITKPYAFDMDDNGTPDDYTDDTVVVVSPSSVTMTDDDYRNMLEGFISWCDNVAVKGNHSLKGDSDSGIGSITDAAGKVVASFDVQSVSQSYPVTVSGTLAHVALSKADTLSKSGSITVYTQYYPLHSFDNQASPGDYYCFQQQVTIPNGSWYNGKWTNKHGGVSVRLCAFFMEKFNIQNTFTKLQGANSDLLNQLPATTVSQVNYTSGSSYGFTGSFTGGTQGGKPLASATVGTSMTWSNSKSWSVSDIDIQNQSNGTDTAAWDVKFNNLTSYNSNISINEPSLPSRSTQLLYTSWIVRVEGVSDAATGPSLSMATSLQGTTWGGTHLYSSKADFKTYDFTPGISGQSVQIAAPNRVPTGKLTLTNNDPSLYVRQIDIFKANTPTSGTPDYTDTDTIPPNGGTLDIWLPTTETNYKFRITLGTKTMHSTGTIKTELGSVKTVYITGDGSADFADGDF
jgi:hypothetical protein